MAKVGRKKGTPKTGGRKKGTPNKLPSLLRDDILKAAANAHPDGVVGYLTEQAKNNPTHFLTLLGKILPTQMQHTGADGGPIKTEEIAADADAFTSRISGLIARISAAADAGGSDAGDTGGS